MAPGGGTGAASGPRLTHICRHPIKSIGHEELAHTQLEAGKVLPLDRRWAVAHARADLLVTGEGALASWEPKSRFLRGVAAPELMAIRARTDLSGDRPALALTHPQAATLHLKPGTSEGNAALLDWLRPLWPADMPAPKRLISLQGGALTDRPEPFISLLNLATLRDLEAQMGLPLSIHRWRGNLWIDGLAPWEEFDLIGQEVSIGAARLRVERRITRCKATCADPATGTLNGDTLAALQAGQGHRDFGVYATVINGGEIGLSDKVSPS